MGKKKTHDSSNACLPGDSNIIALERRCGTEAAEKGGIDVLLCLCIKVRYCKTGKNSVWAMECGTTTQSSAINDGMQG